MTNLVGHSLGRYHILEQLGEGGMAVVYKALDTRLENEVAVKVIRTENILPSALGRSLKRFEREAKALARLSHPNIVKVLDYGEQDGKPYLVMPFLPGGTLKERLKQGPLPWQEAARLLLPIAQALEYAHKQSLVHRDVKPSNILLTESGQPMLTDFGIAKILDLEETTELTGTSVAIGTPEYMAPEQATAKHVDHRADIYSLGIVFYEMVTGRKPFVADTPLAVLFKHASEPLPRPTRFQPNLPGDLERILLKALAKSPADRYQSMGEIAAALDKLLKGQTVRDEAGARETIDELAAPRQSETRRDELGEEKSPVQSLVSLIAKNWQVALGVVGVVGCLLLLTTFRGSTKDEIPVAPAPIVTDTSLPLLPITVTLPGGATDTPTFTPTKEPTDTPTSTPTKTPTNTPTLTPKPKVVSCPNALPTRVQIGMTIQVTTSGQVPTLGIRPEPNLDSHKMFELKSGSRMTVLDGPVCSNDSYFWYVNTSNGTGWVREANTQFYFVDPL